jgi:putative two-component system response regulator
MAARIAQSHHERWDGSGYPLGLKGEDIPLEGRIVAVADVFDALSSRRPYKPPFPRDQCFEILREGRGRQFDPAVLDAFFQCSAEIVEVQLLLMDSEETPRETSD